MAIKLKTLDQASKTYTQQNYVYKDLALDIQRSALESPGFNLPIPGIDIKASFDKAAIRNSLQNLFNTTPGQRFLFPEYGLNLNQFLFLPVSEQTSQTIGETMIRAIERFEPRVQVQNINILPDEDNNTYYITLILQIPILSQPVSFDGQLNINSQSFIFLPTTKT
jgi:phage baseplate assembly protein W